MNALKQWLRKRLLTDAEQTVLEDYARLARAFGDIEFSRGEAEDWARMLRTPTGRKIDALMCDHIQQQAMRAIANGGAELPHACGMAQGARTAWVMAKSLSTMGAAQSATSEEQPDTAGLSLAHLNP